MRHALPGPEKSDYAALIRPTDCRSIEVRPTDCRSIEVRPHTEREMALGDTASACRYRCLDPTSFRHAPSLLAKGGEYVPAPVTALFQSGARESLGRHGRRPKALGTPRLQSWTRGELTLMFAWMTAFVSMNAASNTQRAMSMEPVPREWPEPRLREPPERELKPFKGSAFVLYRSPWAGPVASGCQRSSATSLSDVGVNPPAASSRRRRACSRADT